jgi:hypothetical protein
MRIIVKDLFFFQESKDIFKRKYEARTEGSIAHKQLLGGCPRQYGPILKLITQLKYYDTPPYLELANLLDAAVQTTNASVSF